MPFNLALRTSHCSLFKTAKPVPARARRRARGIVVRGGEQRTSAAQPDPKDPPPVAKAGAEAEGCPASPHQGAHIQFLEKTNRRLIPEEKIVHLALDHLVHMGHKKNRLHSPGWLAYSLQGYSEATDATAFFCIDDLVAQRAMNLFVKKGVRIIQTESAVSLVERFSTMPCPDNPYLALATIKPG